MESSFKKYNLSDELIKSIDLLNFKSPTLVQEQVIPAIFEQKNIIVKSQTGSGKTASFSIPICELVNWDDNLPQALVITPTRELAIQVKEDIFNIGRFKRIKISSVYGKESIVRQEKELKQKTHVVVGTPGRIIDLCERKSLDFSNIKYLVIDEADQILNMGFIEQTENIISRLPKNRVTILLSATMPEDIKKMSSKYIESPLVIEIEEQSRNVDRISQESYNVKESEKINLLNEIMILENPDSCIFFCNTKQKVDMVTEELNKSCITVEKIHGGMEQVDRLKVMNDFRRGIFKYLVATDVAARGIDIDNINLIINYDVPVDKEIYVHRIGRTGRIGKEGKAITFVTQYENRFLTEIENFVEKKTIVKTRPNQEIIDNLKNKFMEDQNKKPILKNKKGHNIDKEIMKIHINAGKKTKMRAVDIVGTLCNLDGIDPSDVGIIEIRDVSTFVEILNNKGDLVLAKLRETPIKGRLRKVNKVEIEKN